MRHTIGLSVGPPSDSTGLVAIETNDRQHAVRRIQRFPPGTAYSAMHSTIEKILDALDSPIVVLDRTGIGTPIADTFRFSKASTIPVVLTAGEQDTASRPRRLPRRDVADLLQLALQELRLTVARVPLAEDLARDLRVFNPKPGTGAPGELAWRDRPSDDLVLALAVALSEADRGPVRASVVYVTQPRGRII